MPEHRYLSIFVYKYKQDVTTCVTGDKMTEDELNSLIAHAHKRISQLQRQLASQQARYQHDLQLALAKQCEEDGQLAAEKVVMEQRRLQEEFQMEKAKWVSV